MNKLTKKQEEVLNQIKNFIKENGYSPSVRELCDIQGIKSTCTMFNHLQKLKAKGYIDYHKFKSRTIRVLEV